MSWFSSRKQEAPVVDRNQVALNRAANSLDLMALKQALLLGADPYGGPEIAISPLVTAAVSIQAWLENNDQRQQDVVVALLDAGARPEWAGRDGKNPYEIALRKGWIRVVEKMLDKGADPNRMGLSGPTPLQTVMTISEYKGWPIKPMVDLLLARGADPSLASRQQPIPLVLGLRNPHLADAPDLEATLRALVVASIHKEQVQELAQLARELGMDGLSADIEAASPSGSP